MKETGSQRRKRLRTNAAAWGSVVADLGALLNITVWGRCHWRWRYSAQWGWGLVLQASCGHRDGENGNRPERRSTDVNQGMSLWLGEEDTHSLQASTLRRQ